MSKQMKTKNELETKTKSSIDNADTEQSDSDINKSDDEEISLSSEPDTDWNDDVDADADVDADVNIGNDTNDNDCIYDNVHKPNSMKKPSSRPIDNDSDDNHGDDDNDIGDDDDDDEVVDDEDIDNIDNNENTINSDVYVKKEDRCSGNILTKYEVVRLLGERTTQLSYGAKPMLNGVNGLPARIIAQLELESKMMPIQIIRPLPNGKKELWQINELILKDIHNVYNFTGGKVNKESVLSRSNKSGGSSNSSNKFY